MNPKTALTSVALAFACAMLSNSTCIFANVQGGIQFAPNLPTLPPSNPTPTLTATDARNSPASIGVPAENLYVVYAALAIATGILIVAATALVLRRKIVYHL